MKMVAHIAENNLASLMNYSDSAPPNNFLAIVRQAFEKLDEAYPPLYLQQIAGKVAFGEIIGAWEISDFENLGLDKIMSLFVFKELQSLRVFSQHSSAPPSVDPCSGYYGTSTVVSVDFILSGEREGAGRV